MRGGMVIRLAGKWRWKKRGHYIGCKKGRGGGKKGGKGKYFGGRLGGQQTRMHLKIALGFYNHRPIPCSHTQVGIGIMENN